MKAVSGRSGGRTKAMLEMIRNTRGLIIVPCHSGRHARSLMELFNHYNFKAQITAKLNKGIQKMPYKSRRSIQIEIFN